MRIRCVVIALCTGSAVMSGAEWPTDGGNPKRTNWQQDETILNKDNVKNLTILWKIHLDNTPQEMHSLFPPLIVDKVNTSSGPKQIAIEAGISDNIYAIDVETGQMLWKKHFEYPTPDRRGRPGDPLCPPGQTATPVVSPPSQVDHGRRQLGRDTTTARETQFCIDLRVHLYPEVQAS